jgi:hypothetical protein
MSARYFKTPTGVAQYGNLTDNGAQTLADAGHEEITAEQYAEAEKTAAEAVKAAVLPRADSEQPTKEVATDGGNKRQRRR